MAIKPASTPTPLTTSTTTSSTHTLSFPAQTFAKLAPIPFLHAHLNSSSGARRPSGRKPSECRPPTLHTGSLSHASGSAVVRIGDTAVVCGIRGEILHTKDVADWKHPDTMPRSSESTVEDDNTRTKRLNTEANEIAHLNLLVPNVELSTGCSPAHLPGSPPSDQAQALSHRVLSLLHTTRLLKVEDLRIWHHPSSTLTSSSVEPMTAPNPNNPSIETSEDVDEVAEVTRPQIKAYWTLHITILFLSLDGNPFDAAWCSLLAALLDIRLPRAWWDPDLDSILCSPEASEATRLSLNGLPIPLTVGAIGREDSDNAEQERPTVWILADMDEFEEGCVRETACMVVKGDGQEAELVRIEKNSGGMIGREGLREIVVLAGRRWRVWKGLLEEIQMGVETSLGS